MSEENKHFNLIKKQLNDRVFQFITNDEIIVPVSSNEDDNFVINTNEITNIPVFIKPKSILGLLGLNASLLTSGEIKFVFKNLTLKEFKIPKDTVVGEYSIMQAKSTVFQTKKSRIVLQAINPQNSDDIQHFLNSLDDVEISKSDSAFIITTYDYSKTIKRLSEYENLFKQYMVVGEK